MLKLAKYKDSFQYCSVNNSRSLNTARLIIVEAPPNRVSNSR
ncbi:MAG: hypothetical protein SAK29_03225 [Scytonema sp. PMC 1069.18]|nr:hypothetical protein [Scytonema sp. PMC 1069.18]MEC4884551.1 hypothetical protein [Scytonema sp. PMC 1070.18]